MVTVTTNARTKFCNCGDDWIIKRESEKLSNDPLSDPKKKKELEKKMEKKRKERKGVESWEMVV